MLAKKDAQYLEDNQGINKYNLNKYKIQRHILALLPLKQ